MRVQWVLENKFLVGTSKGQLLIYELTSMAYGSSASPRIWQSKKEFVRNAGAITQLDVIPELNLLLSVVESVVHFHALDTFEYKGALPSSKGTLNFVSDLQV